MKTLTERRRVIQRTPSPNPSLRARRLSGQDGEAGSVSYSQYATGQQVVAGPSSTAGASRFPRHFSRIPLHPPTGLIQAKLEVGAEDDPLEQEADEMADQALQVSASDADGKPLPAITAVPSGTRPAAPRQDAEEEDGLVVRPYGVRSNDTVMDDETESRVTSLSGKGAALPESVRQPMGRGFGFDFSSVRIHADSGASRAAQSLGAHAFTYRNNIVFAPGRYSPHTGAGRHLLAHELAHVVQQARRPVTPVAHLRRGRRHLTATEAEGRADRAATNMKGFLTQNILFDFWGGDLRDNDKNGVVDGFRPDASRGRDRRETGSHDGDHFRGTFHGFKTWGGLRFTGGEGGTVDTVDFETSTTVRYRVCADLVSAAYRAASIPVPQTRRVRELVHWFQTNRQARFWPAASFTGPFQKGDFICSYSPKEGHGHSGMIVKTGTTPDVVHLPGQSQHIARGVYDPRRLNDVTHEQWPSNRTIFGIGRFVG